MNLHMTERRTPGELAQSLEYRELGIVGQPDSKGVLAQLVPSVNSG
jgi:hypothetical protein